MKKTKKAIYIIIAVLTIGCTGKGTLPSGKNKGGSHDTIYTQSAAMNIYAYQPVRALGAGAETDALRTEAEMGAALYLTGQQELGMAKLDSAISLLGSSLLGDDKKGAFNELDALIIALKRKISVLGSDNKYAMRVT